MERREALATLLKGAAMGTADTVPGVSGGTVAMIVGIYDRLVGAIAALHPRPLAHLLRVHEAEGRAAIRRAWTEMDLSFLVLLGTGMVSAVVALSQVIPVALEEAPALTGAFFVGLILASVVLIGRTVPWTSARVAIAVVAAAVATAVATTTSSAADPSLALVFVAGAVAISAMVLPGLSGALLLLILGQYDYLLSELDAFLEAVAGAATGASLGAVAAPGTVVAVFLCGAVLGVLTVARAVDYALERDRATTIAALVGLMAGGLYPPGRNAVVEAETTAPGVAAVVAVAVLGAVVVLGFDYATDDLDYVEDDAEGAEPAGEGSVHGSRS